MHNQTIKIGRESKQSQSAMSCSLLFRLWCWTQAGNAGYSYSPMWAIAQTEMKGVGRGSSLHNNLITQRCCLHGEKNGRKFLSHAKTMQRELRQGRNVGFCKQGIDPQDVLINVIIIPIYSLPFATMSRKAVNRANIHNKYNNTEPKPD